MAKTSAIARNDKRGALAKKYDERRREYKKIITAKDSTPEQVEDAFRKQQKIPRNASPVRYRNRCMTTGRARSVYSKFGLCRNEIRRLAHLGQLVGVTKSSW
ncbi:30S ribosomal protein S14 [soil metagenome]